MRFKLKSDYLSFAREQIRGGLWYKPPWWDAVSRVPPAHFQPRITKKDVPRIKFMEDKLLRKFQLRNPALVAFDTRGNSSSSASSSSSSSSATLSPLNSKTLSAAFVEKQISLMKTQNMTEEQAYKLTQVWLLENGKDLCTTKLQIPYDVQTILNLSPSTLLEARKLIEQELQQQVDDVRVALRSGNRASLSSAVGTPSSSSSSSSKKYRLFPSSSTVVNDTERISLRGYSKEYILPRGPGYESDEELKLSSSSSFSSSSSSSKTITTAVPPSNTNVVSSSTSSTVSKSKGSNSTTTSSTEDKGTGKTTSSGKNSSKTKE